MKEALKIFFALILAAGAIAIVGFNIHTLTTPLLIAAASCLVFAMALAIPADFKQAAALARDSAPDGVFGRRKYDQPENKAE